MDEQIVKLSDMERAETLRGFYALGVNDNNRSVVADLGAVEDAAESANEAAESANEAAEGAEKVNVTMEGTMLSVTDREGNTTTTDVKGKDGKDGKDGENGAPGKDGKDGEDGAPGKDGRDGAPLYMSFKVDPHNMHLYASEDSNRIAINSNKHFTVNF